VLLLDTSGLLCYLHQDERQHQQAIQFFNQSNASLTHNYVLAELVALAQIRGFPRIPTLNFINDLLEHPDIEVIWVDESLHRKAVALLMARKDKAYSLCDAVSFVLMQQRDLTEALTTDRHFEQEGFQRLLTG
jgi:predicted nucleic acid-binding protein